MSSWERWWESIVEIFQHTSIVAAILLAVSATGALAEHLFDGDKWISKALPMLEQYVAIGVIFILSVSLGVSFLRRYLFRR